MSCLWFQTVIIAMIYSNAREQLWRVLCCTRISTKKMSSPWFKDFANKFGICALTLLKIHSSTISYSIVLNSSNRWCCGPTWKPSSKATCFICSRNSYFQILASTRLRILSSRNRFKPILITISEMLSCRPEEQQLYNCWKLYADTMHLSLNLSSKNKSEVSSPSRVTSKLKSISSRSSSTVHQKGSEMSMAVPIFSYQNNSSSTRMNKLSRTNFSRSVNG